MKNTTALRVLIVSTIVLATAAGCKSGNYQKGAATAAGLTESADRITAGKAKIDAATTSLNDLVNNPQGDLEAKYKKYSSAVSDLESAAEDVRDKVTSMRKSGKAYLDEWDKQLAQIKNEDIKSRSTERKAEVLKKFTEIKKGYVEAQTAFKPFMADLKDIQQALGTDLTTGGIASVKNTAGKVNQNAEKLKSAMDQIATEFREIGVQMASSAPATPPPAK